MDWVGLTVSTHLIVVVMSIIIMQPKDRSSAKQRKNVLQSHRYMHTKAAIISHHHPSHPN
jgi:hypothetical protein